MSLSKISYNCIEIEPDFLQKCSVLWFFLLSGSDIVCVVWLSNMPHPIGDTTVGTAALVLRGAVAMGIILAGGMATRLVTRGTQVTTAGLMATNTSAVPWSLIHGALPLSSPRLLVPLSFSRGSSR